MSKFPWHLVPNNATAAMPEEVQQHLHARTREKFFEVEPLVYEGPELPLLTYPVPLAEELRMALMAVGFEVTHQNSAKAWISACGGRWGDLASSDEQNVEHLLRFLRPAPPKPSGTILERLKTAIGRVVSEADDTGCCGDLTVTGKSAVEDLEGLVDELADLTGRGDDPRMEAFGNLLWSLFEQLIKVRKGGEIPDNWDLHEIRQWLADAAAREVFSDVMKGKRLKDYRTVVSKCSKLSSPLG